MTRRMQARMQQASARAPGASLARLFENRNIPSSTDIENAIEKSPNLKEAPPARLIQRDRSATVAPPAHPNSSHPSE